MPQPSIRPDVVVLFTDVDWHGHLDDPTRPYHRDGRPFTHAEHLLLTTITPEEQAAGLAQLRREADWLRDLDAKRQVFVDLVLKYLAKLPEGSVVDDAIDIMTDEDYAEYERLLPIVTAEDTLEYLAERTED
ncbi:hypothetical protein [Streptomyces sp. NPDC046685]|uniref:hypothetical protein n=1 Tax=Streptomyces sp. NPDC046685 TaxID=3157202 RepID=UPI0033D7E998